VGLASTVTRIFTRTPAFHLTHDDVRQQPARLQARHDLALRGLFNQQIHGAKRFVRGEDFYEFEQKRTRILNGDSRGARAGRQT